MCQTRELSRLLEMKKLKLKIKGRQNPSFSGKKWVREFTSLDF